MNLSQAATVSEASIIREAAISLARYGVANYSMRKVAEMRLTFGAIMKIVRMMPNIGAGTELCFSRTLKNLRQNEVKFDSLFSNETSASQEELIADTVGRIAAGGLVDMEPVARLPVTFTAIMRVAYKQKSLRVSVEDIERFRVMLHVARNTRTAEKLQRHADAAGMDAVEFAMKCWTQQPAIQQAVDQDYVARLQSMITPSPTHGAPNGGNRVLNSAYTQLDKKWLRSNGKSIYPGDMTKKHLDNVLRLLMESHGNVAAKAELALGKIASHYANDPAIQHCILELLDRMQKVDVDHMYPIFKAIAKERESRNTTYVMDLETDMVPESGQHFWED